ncbi:MAG TPA: DUF3347 domain-containing protein [Cyclobacteriaceae bacterium]|nr:DUF3347 domain-containing protein [Cyclobacteriaceae bacterium]HRJ82957.1 DUF3347 domain-containing protein [Cyclobacteriaceae bacterium]
MKNLFSITLFILAACLLLASCNKSTNTSAANETAPVNEELKTTLTAYFKLKDALVKDDSVKAQEAATALAAVTGSYAEQLNEYVLAVGETTNIDEQREAFDALSVALYDLVKGGSLGMTIYKQYCPMAFNDRGAFWLSGEKQVLNPYFGASMLRCGSVKEEIN